MKLAAAPLIYLWGDDTFTLTKLAETSTTITFGWTPPQGVEGYRFTREKAPIKPNGKSTYSHSWDGTQDKATFFKDSTWYSVEALSIPFAAKGS